MQKFPLVSYIVPVYNVENYLERCVNSLLSQTYPAIEIILVDDGSTDASAELCDKLTQCHSTVKVYHIPNGGASFARKYGLERASGEYVGFVDSDDTVDYMITELLMEALLDSGLKISVCTNKKKIDDGSNWNETYTCNPTHRCLNKKELMERFFHYEFWGFVGKIYHRTVFDNIYFPKATINEDFVVMAQLFLNEHAISYVSAPLYHYRLHLGGLSSLALNERKFEEIENTAYVYQYFKLHDKLYVNNALSIYIESCIKLIKSVYNENKQNEYFKYIKHIRFIFFKHFAHSMINTKLSWKLKILQFLFILTPKWASKL